MPRLIVTEGAAVGIARCRAFLTDRNPQAATRAGQVVARHLLGLERNPAIGRPFDLDADLREPVIPFGATAMSPLYRHDAADGAIHLLAFRHQREAGY